MCYNHGEKNNKIFQNILCAVTLILAKLPYKAIAFLLSIHFLICHSAWYRGESVDLDLPKPKVLQVNKFYYPVTGGVEKVVQQLAEGLKDKTDMKVLACQQSGKAKQENIHGVPVLKSGSFGVFFSMPVSLSFFRDFRKLSKDADLIHMHMPFPLGDLAYLLSPASRKKKLILWWHSDIVKQKKFMLFYRPLLALFLKRADLIIAATEGHVRYSPYLRPHTDKCVIIPYGVNEFILERATKFVKEQMKAPESISLSKLQSKAMPIPELKSVSAQEEPLKLLFVGRLVYYKGCKILIEAFAKAIQSSNDKAKSCKIELTIVGSGPLEDELRRLSESLKLSGKLHFARADSDEELCQFYAACDVFVLPSVAKSEAFGLVQIEAMSFGKPVINTALESGVPYVSLDGVTGLTVPPSDPEALAAAITWMQQHPKERKEMGINARKRVLENFQMSKTLDSVLSVYHRALKQ